MEGYEVINDQGVRAWWNGVRVTPLAPAKENDLVMEADKASQASKEANDRAMQSLASAREARQPKGADTFTEARKTGIAPITAQPPRFPKAEKFAQEYAGPLATGAAGLATAPVSIPLQMGLGAVTEAVGQKLGGKELDPLAIGGAALLPPVVRGGIGAVKHVARGVGKMLNKEGMIEAGIDKIKGKFGVGTAPAKALEIAKGKTASFTNDDLLPLVEKLTSIVTKEEKAFGGSDEALKVANKVYEKLSTNQYNYGDLFDSVTSLRQQAGKAFNAGDSRTGNAIKEIRSAVIDRLDEFGPEASQAIKLYKRQESLNDIADVLRKGRPVNEFTKLMQNDKLVASAFTEVEKKQLTNIVKDLGSENLLKIAGAAGLGMGVGSLIGGEGNKQWGAAGAGAMSLVLGALVSTPVGKVFAKSLIGPGGKVSSSVMPAFAQYLRGYMAQQGTDKPTP